jgi:endonuclease YncB( thermonuclease family)
MKKLITSMMVALMLSAVSIAPMQALAKDNLEWSNKISGQGVIYQVVDGDTIWLNVNDQRVFNKFLDLADTKDKKKALRETYKAIKIRIANIDTEESVHRDVSRNTKKGKESSNYLKSIAEKRNAEFVCWQYAIGRPVCSVEFKENSISVDIGYRMISKGHSDYVTAWGKHPYAHNEYLKAAR